MTTTEHTAQLRRMAAAADRVRTMRGRRLQETCRAAGVEYVCLHNALVGLHRGQPWRGVDYSLARKADRIRRTLYDADHIVSRWYARTVRDIQPTGANHV